MTVREIVEAVDAGAAYELAAPRPYATAQAREIDEAAAAIEAGARAAALQRASAAAAPGAGAWAKASAEIAAIHVRNAANAEMLVRASDIESALSEAEAWLTEAVSTAMSGATDDASDHRAQASLASYGARLRSDYENRVKAAFDLLAARARLAAWIEASEELAKIDKPMCAAVTVESTAAH